MTTIAYAIYTGPHWESELFGVYTDKAVADEVAAILDAATYKDEPVFVQEIQLNPAIPSIIYVCNHYSRQEDDKAPYLAESINRQFGYTLPDIKVFAPYKNGLYGASGYGFTEEEARSNVVEALRDLNTTPHKVVVDDDHNAYN
jgi:hypothetical protein